MPKEDIQKRINGEGAHVLCDPRHRRVAVRTARLALAATVQGRRAASDGNCGVGSVVLVAMLEGSCVVLAVGPAGGEVWTIEGVATASQLHPLQQKFLEQAALQCGIFTPGFIMAAKERLAKNPKPTE